VRSDIDNTELSTHSQAYGTDSPAGYEDSHYGISLISTSIMRLGLSSERERAHTKSLKKVKRTRSSAYFP
jgi:hypothetical protein